MIAVIKQNAVIEKIIIFRDRKTFNIVIFSSETFYSLFQIVNRIIHLFYCIISFSFTLLSDHFYINIRDLIKLIITLSFSKICLILKHYLNELYNMKNSYFKLLLTTTSDLLFWTSFMKIFNIFFTISFTQDFNRSI